MVFLWILIALILLLLLCSFGMFLLACLRIDRLTANLDKMLTRPVYRDCREEVLAARDWSEQQPHEQVYTTSYDGLKLAATFYPCENARGTIVMFHGWRGSPLADFGVAMSSYFSKGLNLLLVHQRTQGPSQGCFITFGLREQHDVHSWVKWHTQRFGSEAPILLTGISMGASTVLMAAGTPFEANVRGIIADCGFTSPRDIIASVVRSVKLPTFPFVPLMGLFTRLIAGFGLREYSTLEAVKHLHLPVFFAHGEADTFVPCSMTKETFAACGSPDKSLLLVPKAGHGASYLLDRDNYENLIAQFINRCL